MPNLYFTQLIRIIFVALLAGLLLSGCSGPSLKSTTSDTAQNTESDDIVKIMLQDNGEYMLCDQPKYRQCFNVSIEACIAEASLYKETCIVKASEKIPTIDSTEAAGQFTGIFYICMSAAHMMLHASELEQISECLKNIEFDKETSIKSLTN